jgi:alpha-N-acetylglucosamine transferase
MKKNLLFSSVGDRTKFFDLWCDENRNYDIIICYYGDITQNTVTDEFMDFIKIRYENYVDFYYERKGSKFQNFNHLWKNNIFNINNYEKFFIVDDDIILSTNEINQLFDLMDKYDLDLLQPSFDNIKSKISHECTKSIDNAILHYTNFIEVTAPLFNKQSIDKCMYFYNDSLLGYGIDYLFMWVLGVKKENKYAVIDFIKCINPHQEIREIDLLQPTNIRINKWLKIKKNYCIPNLVKKTFKIIFCNNN